GLFPDVGRRREAPPAGTSTVFPKTTLSTAMHPKMTLQQLRDLMAVVEHGGFRAAARALHVSQSGLTKSLARFEKEHGVSLIERHAKGVILTPQGEEFVRYARSVLFEANRTEEWLRRVR